MFSEATELRKRNLPTNNKQESTGQSATSNATPTNNANTFYPSNVKASLETALGIIFHIIRQLMIFWDIAYPVLDTFWVSAIAFYKSLAPYHPELLFPTLIGLILCFFGGEFVLCIAAVEAYRICGWETSSKCISDLIIEFNNVLVASKKDDTKDDNNDGIPDVDQIPRKELFNRKCLVFFQTVEPERFANALNGLNIGFVAVVATLKLQFCMALTLGASICDVIMPPILRIFVPIIVLIPTIPPVYHKWIPVILTYFGKYICISFAFFLQRVVSAFHSAIRGGLMIARNFLDYLRVMNIVHINHNETYLDEIVGYFLAFCGFYFQARNGFGLPFPLNLLLLPVSIVESFLTWAVAFK